jgi:RNA polymerase sigma-70 factor, ECF subfamily
MMVEPMATAAEGPMAHGTADVTLLDGQFDRWRPGLVRLCASMVGADDADDVVQDVYMLARQRIAQLHDPAALEPWLKRIAVNRCYDWHRRRKRLRDRLPLLRRTETVSDDRSLVHLVEALPPRQRTVIVLHYAYGYGLHEIAELLSLTHVNVRTIIARTRRSLLEAWREAQA